MATGKTPEQTTFQPPAGFNPNASYTLYVIANGISSDQYDVIVNSELPAAAPSSAAASSGVLPVPNTVALAKPVAPAVLAAPHVRDAALGDLISQGGLRGPFALTNQEILNELAVSLPSLIVSGDSSLSDKVTGRRWRGGTLAFKGFRET